MRYLKILFLILTALLVSNCARPLPNSVEDVKSIKYLEFGKYPVGSGKVFVMTQSYISKTYPSEDEKIAILNISTRLQSLGYQLASSPKSADFIFMCMWTVRDNETSSDSDSADGISDENIYIHTMQGTFIKTKGSGTGKDLWNARNTEAWLHPNLNIDGLSRVLAEKFPN